MAKSANWRISLLQKRPLRGQSRPVDTSGAEQSPLPDLGLAVIDDLGRAGIGPDVTVRACSPIGELQLNPHDHLLGGRDRCDGRLRRYDAGARTRPCLRRIDYDPGCSNLRHAGGHFGQWFRQRAAATQLSRHMENCCRCFAFL